MIRKTIILTEQQHEQLKLAAKVDGFGELNAFIRKLVDEKLATHPVRFIGKTLEVRESCADCTVTCHSCGGLFNGSMGPYLSLPNDWGFICLDCAQVIDPGSLERLEKAREEFRKKQGALNEVFSNLLELDDVLNGGNS